MFFERIEKLIQNRKLILNKNIFFFCNQHTFKLTKITGCFPRCALINSLSSEIFNFAPDCPCPWVNSAYAVVSASGVGYFAWPFSTDCEYKIKNNYKFYKTNKINELKQKFNCFYILFIA